MLGVGWFWATCKCCCICPWDSASAGPQQIKIKGHSDGDVDADCSTCLTESESDSSFTGAWDGHFYRKDVCLFTPSAGNINTETNIDGHELATDATRVVYNESDKLWNILVKCDNADGTNSLLWKGEACRLIDVYQQVDGCSPGPSTEEIVEVA
jgi:hypothetical protein